MLLVFQRHFYFLPIFYINRVEFGKKTRIIMKYFGSSYVIDFVCLACLNFFKGK